MKGIRVAFAVLFIIFLLPLNVYSDMAAAKKEGRVVVYGSLESSTMNLIKKAFEEKHGIAVDYWQSSSTKVMDRATAESRAGKHLFDVMFNHAALFNIMKKEGIISSYKSPSFKFFPPRVIDKDIGPAYRTVVVGILYNEAHIKPEDAPKSYDDLLAPRWKGKFVMPDPTRHTTTAQWLASLHTIMGEEKAENYIKGLANQKPVLVRSLTPASLRILSGEVPLGITFLKYIVIYGKKGAKLDYVKVDKMIGAGQYVNISANPVHPNAAKLFIDYFLSRDNMKVLADVGEYVTVEGIYPPLKNAEKIKFELINEERFDKKTLIGLKEKYRKIFK
jgi:iron(III) transport system substrate-binding protein